MSDDDLEDRTTDFMYALAASEADVANISAERTENDMRVTLDLNETNDADLVRRIAEEHCFDQHGDTGERFESQS